MQSAQASTPPVVKEPFVIPPSPSPPPPTKHPKSKPAAPVGAIVGGVIGGLLGLAIIVYAAYYYTKKSKDEVGHTSTNKEVGMKSVVHV
jgi:hypothetical protein